METHASNKDNNRQEDITSLEKGKCSTDHDYHEMSSSKSQRTMKSRKKVKRKDTIFSNSNRPRTNSSFQYPSNTSVFSTGVSMASPDGESVSSPTSKARLRVQTMLPNTYHYEIVPTSFPDFDHNSNSSNDTEEPLSGLHDSTVDGISDNNHNNTSATPGNVRTINNGSKVFVKPKQIHQNPLTPAMLPKGFTPINQWGRLKNKYHKEWLAEFLRHPRHDDFGGCVFTPEYFDHADKSFEVL